MILLTMDRTPLPNQPPMHNPYFNEQMNPENGSTQQGAQQQLNKDESQQ